MPAKKQRKSDPRSRFSRYPCNVCGEYGHWSDNCPNSNQKNSSDSNSNQLLNQESNSSNQDDNFQQILAGDSQQFQSMMNSDVFGIEYSINQLSQTPEWKSPHLNLDQKVFGSDEELEAYLSELSSVESRKQSLQEDMKESINISSAAETLSLLPGEKLGHGELFAIDTGSSIHSTNNFNLLS